MKFYKILLDQLIWCDTSFARTALLKRIDRAHNNDPSGVVVATLKAEADYPVSSEVILFLQELKTKQIPVVVLANTILNGSDIINKITELGISIIYIDYFAWRVYNEIIVKNKNKVNLSWNSSANKFLFLTGKPNKIHRIGLLWKLHQKELLTNAIWSLYVQEPDRIATCKEINNIGVSIEQANQFIDQHQCIPDAANIHFYPEGSSHYGGIPYAETMYSDVKFRIISETRFKSDKNNFPWVTEKTWLTIVNRCPFIMVGEPGTLDYLESMGFKTFKNYLKIHDYDNIRPIGNRLDAIVTNTEYWLNDADFADEIQLDVEHNYNRFIELGKEIETNVLQQIHDNKLQAQLDDIVSTDDPLAKK